MSWIKKYLSIGIVIEVLLIMLVIIFMHNLQKSPQETASADSTISTIDPNQASAPAFNLIITAEPGPTPTPLPPTKSVLIKKDGRPDHQCDRP